MMQLREDACERRERMEELRQRLRVQQQLLIERSARLADGLERASKVFRGPRAERYGARALLWQDMVSHYQAQLGADPDGPDLPSTPEQTHGITIEDVIDTSSSQVEEGAAFARALVTARGQSDLGDYLDLISELKKRLDGAGLADDVDFVLGLVGSEALIAAVVVHSAESAGMTTSSGQPLLVDLYRHLESSGTDL
jgi:hypothetical protein